jgi:uncharacterized membrane protein
VRDFLIRFLVAGVVMGVLDALWLAVIANRFYRREIGDLLLAKPNFVAAIIFYLVYVAGIVVFVVTPAVNQGSWVHAALYGALLGLVAYATYDLTNLATLKGFTVTVVVVDIIWGVVLTSVVSVSTYAIVHSW